MTRTLNAAMLADIIAQSAEKTELIELRFAAGTTYLTTASQDLLWNGHTWQAVGGAMAVEGFGESADESSNGCRLTLCGANLVLLGAILAASCRGRKAVCYYAHFSPVTGLFIADPLTMFDGYMNDGFAMEEVRDADGNGTLSISTRLTSRISEISKRRGIRTNVHSHQAEIPGASADTFFVNVPGLAGKRVYWGIKHPTGGVGVPSGGGGNGPTAAVPNGPGGNGMLTNPNSYPWGTHTGSPWGGPQPGQASSLPPPNMDPG